MKARKAPKKPAKQRAYDRKNSVLFPLRIPRDLYDSLRVSAEQTGRNLSQEIRRRLSEKRDRFENQKEIRALAFLLSEAAARVHIGAVPNWHQDPFLFSAFTAAFARILEELRPKGEAKNPLKKVPETFLAELTPTEASRLASYWSTPEETGARIAQQLIDDLFRPDTYRNVSERLREMGAPAEHQEMAKLIEEEVYGMKKAHRDWFDREAKS